MTPMSAFGRDRSGTPAHLRDRGFEVIEVEPQVVDGALISSSRIRSEIAAGRVEDAGHLLGRQAGMWGTVVHGDGRGRDLGYPTANLAFDYLPALPAVGIYLGAAGTAERGFLPALVSVGRRPTFGAGGAVLVEAHILDWSGDLYGQELTVTVAARLRDEERFASVEALVEQMRRDEANARARLEGWSEADVGPV
jgi:riboflavin kinase/FMN adenylyltransferase